MRAQLYCSPVPVQLQAVHGTRVSLVPRSQNLETLKVERKREADQIRRMKQMSQERISKTTVVPRRQSDADIWANRRRSTGNVAAWLDSLQSVTTAYRRAKLEERAAALRETVRLRREARDYGRSAASSELDRQRIQSAFMEQQDRCAMSSALERRNSAHRQAVKSCLKARQRAADFMAARRENTEFADHVARRIVACSKAHVRFVQQEHQDLRRQMVATAIHRQKNERRQREAEIERVVESKCNVIASRGDADRFGIILLAI